MGEFRGTLSGGEAMTQKRSLAGFDGWRRTNTTTHNPSDDRGCNTGGGGDSLITVLTKVIYWAQPSVLLGEIIHPNNKTLAWWPGGTATDPRPPTQRKRWHQNEKNQNKTKTGFRFRV